MLQQLIPHKRITSAGVGALVGHAADETASLVAQEHGLSLDGHIAKQLTKEMCREFSLILVMEKGHIEAVCRLAPEVRGKTMLFAHWLDNKNIPDPYGKSQEAFEFVYRLLAESAQAWAKVLNR